MGIIIFDVEWHVGHMMVSNEHILYKWCLCTVAEILCGSAYMSEVRKGRADANMCSKCQDELGISNMYISVCVHTLFGWVRECPFGKDTLFQTN